MRTIILACLCAMGCVKANQVDENEAFRAQQKAQWAKVDAEREAERERKLAEWEEKRRAEPKPAAKPTPAPEPVRVFTKVDDGRPKLEMTPECVAFMEKIQAEEREWSQKLGEYYAWEKDNCEFRDFSTGQVVYTRVDSRGRVYQQIGENAGSGYDCSGVKAPKELAAVYAGKRPSVRNLAKIEACEKAGRK